MARVRGAATEVQEIFLKVISVLKEVVRISKWCHCVRRTMILCTCTEARVAKSLRLSKLLIRMPRGASVAPVSSRILRRRTTSNYRSAVS